jgi:hypothetical protein
MRGAAYPTCIIVQGVTSVHRPPTNSSCLRAQLHLNTLLKAATVAALQLINILPGRGANLRVAVLNDMGRDNGFRKEARMGGYNIEVAIGRVVFSHFEPYLSWHRIRRSIVVVLMLCCILCV